METIKNDPMKFFMIHFKYWYTESITRKLEQCELERYN